MGFSSVRGGVPSIENTKKARGNPSEHREAALYNGALERARSLVKQNVCLFVCVFVCLFVCLPCQGLRLSGHPHLSICDNDWLFQKNI